MTTTGHPPDEIPWTPWHPRDLAHRLRQVSAPWCVVGGWALDLWHGRETRAHEDLEFTVLPDDLPQFRDALGDLDIHTAHDGAVVPLPADARPAPEIAQFWCLDRPAGCWRVDMMLEPGTPEVWAYKRDPTLRVPRADMIARTADGIPYLVPAAVLLFKAKYCRVKDERDFALALPRLPEPERARLRDWLDRFHPGHPWRDALGPSGR